jgi:hypothetical protein
MFAFASIRRLLAITLLVVPFMSCQAGVSDTGGGPPSASSSTQTAQGGSVGTFGIGGSGGGSDCVQCSSDLHSVIDCNGNVLQQCPPDQGCSANGCVPACEAADQNQSTTGCDYWAMAPVSFGYPCFAAYVANTWGYPIDITVEHNGVELPVSSFAYVPQGSGMALNYQPLTGQLQAGEVAILFLSDEGMTCPRQAAVSGASFVGTGYGKGFNIRTSAPVVAYDIFPYGGGSSAVASATLLIPSSAWGDNYVGLTAFERTYSDPWIGMIARENDTEVTISPSVAIVGGGGVAPTGQGVPITYTLQRGDVLKLEQPQDLSGSPVASTKPIGMWAGNGCTDMPIGVQACDGMHQQLPPVRALGSEYTAVRHRDRYPGVDEAAIWRLVGAVDGTTLTYDPPQPGAPTTLASGQSVLFETSATFVVKSQDADHPFYLGQYMTGCTKYWPGFDCRGDPEFVNVIPPAQFRASYVFFTDPTYPTTHLVFTRRKASDGTFKDVNLGCAGNLTGWQPVGSSGLFEYTRFDLVNGNFIPNGSCNNGRQEATSEGPFGVTVWGWGEANTSLYSEACSYAYPGGASVQALNTVVVPPIPR